MSGNKVIKKLYNMAVNLNYWFQHGRTWVLLPFTAIAIAGDIAIFIMFLGMPQSPIILFFLTMFFVLGIIVFGALLFKYKGTQIDKLTAMWQNPLHTIAWIAEYTAAVTLLHEKGSPVPEFFHKWGIREWIDVLKISEYILERGEKAYALPIVKGFFDSIHTLNNKG